MTKEDKELLLKDICTRLPYNVEMHIKGEYKTPRTIFSIHIEDKTVGYFKGLQYNEELIENIKPYLRPMSSMNKKEYLILNDLIDYVFQSTYESIHYNIDTLNEWLNVNHFDYHDLIKKGLALEAPEGMYNIK